MQYCLKQVLQTQNGMKIFGNMWIPIHEKLARGKMEHAGEEVCLRMVVLGAGMSLVRRN